MSPDEQEALLAIYELAGGKGALVPLAELAARLDTSLTFIRTIVALLQSRKLAMLTFGGVALTGWGLNSVSSQREQT